MSHDLLSDPEVWELTNLYGERHLRVWLDILSILDRNDNFVNLTSTLITEMARKNHVTPQNFLGSLVWMITRKGWLTLSGNGSESFLEACRSIVESGSRTRQGPHGGSLKVHRMLEGIQGVFLSARNYGKYHRSREPNGNQTGSPPNLSEPSQTNLKEKNGVSVSSNELRKIGVQPQGTSPLEEVAVDDELRDWAQQEGITQDLDSALGEFQDHHRAYRQPISNYAAAFRNWLRTGQKKAQEKAGPPKQGWKGTTSVGHAKSQCEREGCNKPRKELYGEFCSIRCYRGG